MINKNSSAQLEKAYEIAVAVHKGQTRKFADDEEYIHHPVRVMLKLSGEKQSPSIQAIGLLHDTIEDGNGEELLLKANFPTQFIDKIKALSKPEGMEKGDEAYLSWIRSMDDKAVVLVKMADIEDNMVWRNSEQPSEKWLKLKERYQKAWNILNDKINEREL